MLDREIIRRRLRSAGLVLNSAGRCPEWDDGPTPSGAPRSGAPAAVLVGLLTYPSGARIILTERNAHLRNHAAQVSFPGGRIEESDPDPAAAALREAFEEVGLPPDKVELVGCLEPHETVSGFLVYPFVGLIEPPVQFVLDANEVAEIFEVPLSFVLDPANHRRESRRLDGLRHSYYVLPYPGRRIWGATAEILVDLARALTA